MGTTNNNRKVAVISKDTHPHPRPRAPNRNNRLSKLIIDKISIMGIISNSKATPLDILAREGERRQVERMGRRIL